jgi:alanine dehydrogenase
MPSTLVLTRADVEALLIMEDALPAVERAFAAHARGQTQMPAKVYLSLPEHGGDFRAMPSQLEGSVGVKWVSSHPDNPKKHGLPSVMGVYVLSDPETALPLAIMDATWLTAVRTGAAGGVATKHLFGRAPRAVGFVGCGVQARVLHAAHRALFGAFEALCADLSPEAAARFAAEHGGRVVTVEEACGAEVVCASTPGRGPVVRDAFVRPGAHVNAMGADAPGKQELEAALLTRARIFVDDWEQATHSGEVNVPLHDGVLAERDIVGSLGDVIAGTRPARLGEGDVTVFDSTGLGVQDVAVARVVHERARASGRGLEVALVG